MVTHQLERKVPERGSLRGWEAGRWPRGWWGGTASARYSPQDSPSHWRCHECPGNVGFRSAANQAQRLK